MADNFYKISKGISLKGQSSNANPVNGDMYYDTSINKFRFYENGAFATLGSGGSGTSLILANYIGNPDAEVDTSGWVTYADAAAGAPVDGVGGAPTVSWTRHTTAADVLRGTASFKLTKDAANRQGEGVAYDFTIDNADSPKDLFISFDVNASDAGYVDGDLTVYVYDKDTPVLLTPKITDIEGSKFRFETSFLTLSGTNNLRLIFHVASTNASAWNVFIDGVSVSAETLVPDAPTSEVIVHTGGFTTSHGTVGTKIRRFQTVQTDIGSDIDYVDDGSNGGSFTINKTGIYAMTYIDRANSSTSARFGISKNASSLTTDVDALAAAETICWVYSAEAASNSQGASGSMSITARLNAGDVIRAHTDSQPDNTVVNATRFHITQIVKL